MDEQAKEPPKEFIPPIGQQKKKFNWGKPAAIIIVLAMVSWAVAIAVGDRYGIDGGSKEEKKPSNLIQIGSYDFYILEDYTFGTFLTAGDKKIPIAFRLDPRQAGNISLDYAAIQRILGAQKIYITFNPNQKNLGKFAVASAEISRITSIYRIPTIGAYIEDANPIDEKVPIKTCADTADKTIIMTLSIGKENSVTSDGNCINVSGKTVDDLILAADKLGMNLVGIRL